MSTFAKIMVVVNFVLAIAFLAAAGTLHGAAESWKGRHAALEESKNATIAALEGQLKAKDTELDQVRAANQSLEGRAQAAEAVQKQQAESNAALMRESETKNAQIQSLTAANESQSNALKDATARNEALSNQLATSEAERKQALESSRTTQENLDRETQRADNAETALGALQAASKKLTDDLDAANTALQGYATVYGPLSDRITTKAVRGVVQAASAENDVYVISVGAKDDVKVGYEFTVFRGDRYVSTIVIDSVRPNHATGRTKPGMKKLDIQAGDSVSTGPGL